MRRGFLRRRPGMNPRRQGAFDGGPRRRLLEAYQLMENGEFSQAADLLEPLAQEAQARGFIRRVPHLYLLAARARLQAGQIDRGVELVHRSLGLLAETGNWEILSRVGQRAVNQLERSGNQSQAAQIQAQLDQLLKDHPEALSELPRRGRPNLAEKCPNCGAALHPDEVEWLDGTAAECPYCGSVIRSQ